MSDYFRSTKMFVAAAVVWLLPPAMVAQEEQPQQRMRRLAKKVKVCSHANDSGWTSGPERPLER